jgi:peptidoglycan hydrolase CwlO-like protein
VDKCIAGVDVEVVEEEEDCSALEKELESELAAIEASNSNKKTKTAAARTLKAKYKQLMKDCKARSKATRKAQKDAAKLVISATKKCYRESKKQFTLKNRGSQLTAMEKCFGKPVKREFIKSADFNKAIKDHVSGKKNRESKSSVGAVRLTE